MNKTAAHIISLISIAFAVVIMIMIFSFSQQNAVKSTETSGKVVDVVIEVTVPDFEEHDVSEQQQIKTTTTHYVRKLAHFSEFMALGLFLMLHVKAVLEMKKKRWMLDFMAVAAAGLTYAASDEIHQFFSDGRGPGFTDVMIDFTGVITGIFVVLFIWFIVMKIINNKNKEKEIKEI